jgi:tRNA pseudouridine38-40 synthase
MRFALGLEYCGRGFTGWQSQPDGRGVQDALERALASIADAPVGTVAAGRTDTGVHAVGQVVNVRSDTKLTADVLLRAVNANLPDDVAVLWAQPVASEFHARFDARARHYTYLLSARPVRPALSTGRIGWYHRVLDVASMQESAAALVGTHDFSAFRAAECQAKSPVRTLSNLSIAAVGDVVRFDFTANAYLQHMIRNIVGALVYVGAAKQPPSWIGELLAGRDRTRAAPTFAPDGLYFTGVDYDATWALPPTRRPIAFLE